MNERQACVPSTFFRITTLTSVKKIFFFNSQGEITDHSSQARIFQKCDLEKNKLIACSRAPLADASDPK